MKKGEILEIILTDINFSGECFGEVDGEKYFVKGCVPQDKVRVKFLKNKGGKKICKLEEIIEPSPSNIKPICEKFGQCGGCTYLNLDYEKQIEYKEKAILKLLNDEGICYEKFLGIAKSPNQFSYRNKMEFSFGDEIKGGQLELGLHKKGNPFGVVPTYDCHLVNEDFKKIMKATIEYFRNENAVPYNLKNHVGFLRNLILREGKNEIMVCLVTSSQNEINSNDFVDLLLKLSLNKKITSILHVVSDFLSDAIQTNKFEILYGKDTIEEELFGLKFKINLFSFFQTNTDGMKILYQKVKDKIKNVDGVILDLYSGIGTIGQVISQENSGKVIGIEIVEDAVKMAKENAKLNNLDCEFIVGDVTKVVRDIKEKIDFIIVDPPRAGITRKGVEDICSFNPKNIIYVSCNPKTLIEDLKIFLRNEYFIKTIECVDMFPNTHHVETVVLMSRVEK